MNITEFTDSIKFFLNKDLTVRPCTAIEHFWLIENIAPDLYSPFLAIEDEKQTDYYFYQILNLNTVGKILVFSRDAFVKEWDSVFDFLNFLSLQHDSIYVNKIRLLLLKYWDPIGVGAIPESKFEYDIYINQIIKLLKNKDYDGILKYLLWAEVENMGLLANIERVENVAIKLSNFIEPLNIDSVEQFINLLPTHNVFKVVKQEQNLFWENESIPIACFFGDFGRAIGKNLSSFSDEELKKIAFALEKAVTSSNNRLATAATTGFIEALDNAIAEDSAKQLRLFSILGKESKKYLIEWLNSMGVPLPENSLLNTKINILQNGKLVQYQDIKKNIEWTAQTPTVEAFSKLNLYFTQVTDKVLQDGIFIYENGGDSETVAVAFSHSSGGSDWNFHYDRATGELIKITEAR